MCISDYRIGRLIRSQLDQYSVAVGTPQTIPANRDRVGIFFCTSALITAITTSVTITAGGVVVAKLWSSIPDVRFKLSCDGDLCTKEFILTAATATQAVGVTQLFLPEAEIAALLNEFKRGY